jgi:hypothetical protein
VGRRSGRGVLPRGAGLGPRAAGRRRHGAHRLRRPERPSVQGDRPLADRAGELAPGEATAQGIKAWIAAHPERRQELLNVNPSYIFFREERLPDPNVGPKGALGVPLTPTRSVAVDPAFVPLGAPLFLATTEPAGDVPLQRLIMAQDTGGAIAAPCAPTSSSASAARRRTTRAA